MSKTVKHNKINIFISNTVKHNKDIVKYDKMIKTVNIVTHTYDFMIASLENNSYSSPGKNILYTNIHSTKLTVSLSLNY